LHLLSPYHPDETSNRIHTLQGGFALIYKVTDQETQRPYALKHFRLSGDPEAVRDVQTEMAVMYALRECPFILRLRAVNFSGPAGREDEAFVLLDFCQDSLAGWLSSQAGSHRPLDEAAIVGIFLPVCRAVEAMHTMDPPLAHRDVKAENVLLHPDGRWVLCDFGSATSKQGAIETAGQIALEEEKVLRQTTPAYRAPEVRCSKASFSCSPILSSSSPLHHS
jgi:AP2-associated kinase